MFSRKTILVALLVVCVIDMIHAGVIDDIGEAIHYEDIKKFTTNAAKKTGEAATDAFQSVKNFFGQTTEAPGTATITKLSSQ